MKITIIDGPSLNLLGKREPDIYGRVTNKQNIETLRAAFPDIYIDYFQSNYEGEIIDEIQEIGYDIDCIGIVINPGAYSHYSLAIADAIRAVPLDVIEVHITNIFAREDYRQKLVTGAAAKCIIAGAGVSGYGLAIHALLNDRK